MKKLADSLNDDELKMLADYYNKHRDDRLTVSGDVGRWLLSGGSLASTALYDLNRTGGAHLFAPIIGRKAFTYRRHTQKEVDKANAVLKTMWTGLGGLAGAGMGHAYSDTDKIQNTAIGGALGAFYAFLTMHLAQKIGQNRARKMLNRVNGNGPVKTAQEKPCFPHTCVGRASVSAGAGFEKKAVPDAVSFGIGGAAAGGALGLLFGDRKKRLRNALMAAAFGGLAGSNVGLYRQLSRNDRGIMGLRRAAANIEDVLAEHRDALNSQADVINSHTDAIDSYSDITRALSEPGKGDSSVAGMIADLGRRISSLEVNQTDARNAIIKLLAVYDGSYDVKPRRRR